MIVGIDGKPTKSPFDKVMELQERQFQYLSEKIDMLVDSLESNEPVRKEKTKVKEDILFWVFPNSEVLTTVYRQTERDYKYKLLYSSKALMGQKRKPSGFRTVWGLTVIFADQKKKEDVAMMQNAPHITRLKYSDADEFLMLMNVFYKGVKEADKRMNINREKNGRNF